jgi:hypothetical protein
MRLCFFTVQIYQLKQARFEAKLSLLTYLLNSRCGEKKGHQMLFFSINKQQPFILMMID